MNPRAMGSARRALELFLCLTASAGCSDALVGDGAGTLTILADAEETITAGIEPDDGVENMRDGWRASFSAYVVALGDVTLTKAHAPDEERVVHDVTVVDLTAVGEQGLSLFELSDLDATDWQIHYRTAGAAEGPAARGEGVSRGDYDAMVAADATYLIEGTLLKADGRSCPPRGLARIPDDLEAVSQVMGDPCYDNPELRFRFVVSAETTFGPCRVDGIEGFSVPAGGSKAVSLSVHGDHLFFNGFPQGTEGGIERRAQWLADSDLDLDGEITRDELARIPPPDLAAIADYDLNVPFEELRPVNDMWTYLQAQLKTQGHLDGEGECDADSIGHDH